MGRSIPARGLVLSFLLAAPGFLLAALGFLLAALGFLLAALGFLLAAPVPARAVPLYPALDPAWLPHLPVCRPTDRACDTVARRRIPVCTWRLRPTPEGPRRVRVCA